MDDVQLGGRNWGDESAVNEEDGERLLSKLSPTFFLNLWQKKL